ncbi:MAG: hypothetical protein PHF63_00495 [Herbinix sp.]|nr:hypothetical protein [Herbinix sp.]
MNDIVRVDEWIPELGDCFVGYKNKVFVVPFDGIFKKEEFEILNNFIIKKENYAKKLDLICHYINYFIKFYDDDKELLLAYLKLKSIMDNSEMKVGIKSFIKTTYGILLTDSIIEKINRMVEDNYYVDLTASSNGKKYADILQFNNEHGKKLMAISTAMKIMVPVIFHYASVKKLTKHDRFIYRFYEKLFTIFGEEDQIYNKLWATVSAKINKNVATNKRMWEQREIFGTSPDGFLDELLQIKIISENMFRYTFNGNVINFNSVILRNQLRYFLDDTYDSDIVPLSSDKDSDGLSKMDKFEISNTIIDESIVILAKPSIKKTIKDLKKKIHIEISKEEIEFYKRFHKMSPFQTELALYFYVKYFGGYRDLHMLTRKQYITIMVMLKKILQSQGHLYLPQLISGNIEGRLNNRAIQNMKFLGKITTSSVYKNVIENKYSVLTSFEGPDILIRLLSTIINSSFSYVDFDLPEVIGKPIEFNSDVLSDEFLQYVNMI